MRTPTLLSTVTCSLSLLVTAGCGKAPTGQSEPPPVTVVDNRITFPANARELKSIALASVEECPRATTRLNGRLTWDENATVRVFSPFAGRVMTVTGELGATAGKGSPLALIASPDFGQAQADAHKAATDLAQAERNLARLRELFEHGAAAAKDVAAAESEHARARAEAARTRARLDLYGAESDAIDNRYELKCPIAGTVVERNISVGQEVRPDQMLAGIDRVAAPLFVITDPGRMWAIVDAPENQLPGLHRGQEVVVRMASLPSRSFPGTIEVIGDALDPLARTAKVRVAVINPERLLKSEMLVFAEVPMPELHAVQVPSRAVFLLGERAYVFAQVAPQAFERREVRVGGTQDNSIQVLEGLHAGESIVSDGALLLEQLLEQQTPATPGAAAPPASTAAAPQETPAQTSMVEARWHDVASHNPPIRSPGHR